MSQARTHSIHFDSFMKKVMGLICFVSSKKVCAFDFFDFISSHTIHTIHTPTLGSDLPFGQFVQPPSAHSSPVCCETHSFFPTCQVRVVRFYVSQLLLLLFVLFSSFVSSCVVVLSALKRQPRKPSFVVVVLSALNHDHLRSVFPAGPRDRLRSVFPAGPQPQPSELSVPCRASTATICAQCSLPDLNRDHLSTATI